MLESYLTMGRIKFTRDGDAYVIPLEIGGDLYVESPPMGWDISLRDPEGRVEIGPVHHMTLDALINHILGQRTMKAGERE